jgi:leader peptidase (prepilin peptidase)/N-methyltransferase
VTPLVAIFSVLFGLAFGSFLNVCISRLPKHESIVRPPSRCPACGESVWARDNLPLLGWVLLRGRCRHCGWRIPLRYPLVELATASLFLLVTLTFGLTLEGAGMVTLCFLLFGLAIMDAETLMLPNAFTLPGIALGIAYSGLREGWRNALLSCGYALAAAALIFVIRGAYWLARRQEGMGLGDAKLLAMIAAWLGPWQTMLAFFLGVLTAAIFGLAWIVLKREKKGGLRSPHLPFGSFLCAAAIYAIFEGQPILKWYFQFFH